MKLIETIAAERQRPEQHAKVSQGVTSLKANFARFEPRKIIDDDEHVDVGLLVRFCTRSGPEQAELHEPMGERARAQSRKS